MKNFYECRWMAQMLNCDGIATEQGKLVFTRPERSVYAGLKDGKSTFVKSQGNVVTDITVHPTYMVSGLPAHSEHGRTSESFISLGDLCLTLLAWFNTRRDALPEGIVFQEGWDEEKVDFWISWERKYGMS